MKKLLVITFLFLVTQLQAQVRIGEAEARTTAERFIKQQDEVNARVLALSEEIKSEQSGLTNLYVFSVEPHGFVIVSALGDILAYSLVSQMPSVSALPDHIRYWLNLYNESTDHLITHPEQRKTLTKRQMAVEPLLTSCWGQGCYHNAACPKDDHGPCHHVEAGCVAIAMAQIMYYHKSPLTGNDEMTYTCSPYGTLTANFGQTIYQWDEMADTLHESNPAVATLVYHCGVSVEMRYSQNGSGAYSTDVPDALRRYFFYPATSFARRGIYNDEEWQSMIKNDLDQQHPVYYAGTSSLGGHAFVCDGYDSNGMFHFNYGWDGVADGYYTLASPYGFSVSQSIIHDIYPIDEIPIHSDSHGIIYVAPEGTGDGSSWAQATSELQLALYKSTKDNNSIWVKEGTYTGKQEEEFAFTLLFKCRLYGGFKGDEPYDYDLSQRDFEAHPSILDGNQTQSVIGEISNNNELMIIDGFTIQNGQAAQGGGIVLRNNTQIKNCKFGHNYASNYGGAISQRSSESISILIEDCEFFDNEATSGGAIADYGNTSFVRCVFHDNRASQNGGGVRCVTSGSPSQFVNCTFSNNTAQQGGGIAVSTKQGPTFWSCLINNNTAETGGGCHFEERANLYNCTIVKNEGTEAYGGVYSNNQAPIRNCIVWGNISPDGNIQIGPKQPFTYCAVQNIQSTAGNNFRAAPQNDDNSTGFYVRFKDADVIAGSTGYGGDWRLQPNSLCINRGKSITGQPEFDLDGNPRFRHGNVDLGAYESNTTTHFIETVLCEDAPYYYQDSLIISLGYYSFLYPNIPYDSLVILHMVNPTDVLYIEEICENETFDFFGTPLSEAGVYYKTINCIPYELRLRIKPLVSVHMQEKICDNETFDFFGTPLNETGTYYDTVDCIAYKLDLDVNPLAFHHMEDYVCEGDTYNFFGYSLQQGGHYFKTIDCQHYELDLTVNPKPVLRCSNDTLVEYGNPVPLFASGADSYLWSTGETTESITIFPFTDRAYTVTGFLQNGCSSTATIMVKVINEADEVVLYPNPANNRIEIYKPLIDEVEVFDLMGVLMDRIEANRQLVVLDVSQYASGIYFVHIRCMNNHYFRKLVVRH